MTAMHIHKFINENQVEEILFFPSVHSPFLRSSVETEIISKLMLEAKIVKASQTSEYIHNYYI